MSSADLWYDRFFSHEYLRFDEHPHTHLEIDFLIQTLALTPSDHILDVACGYGRHTIPLARQEYRITGMDRSPVMLQEARTRACGLKIPPSFLQADMRDLPFFETFDIALNLFSSFGYFEEEDENFRVLQNISDVLVPGGLSLIETVNRDYVVRHNPSTQVYRPDNLLLIEERTFDPLTSRSQVDVTVLQNGHETRLHHSIRLYYSHRITHALNRIWARSHCCLG